jgi:uncharacterized protein YhaN
MMIKEVHIYGYGKFEQFRVSFAPYHIVYGKNEAGKSTLMSFIHSILFGFPLKQQSDLRYEPKTNSKYGGQVILKSETWGEIRIERVKGRATGDVTVYLEDGSRGGEELLKKVLNGMDKETFQSIFSFNIHGLQQVDRLHGEELNQFLFSTSAIGTDRIMEAERSIQKQLDKLFKPSGVKPVLNVQLKQLKQTEKKLNEAKVKIDQYETLIKKLETIKADLATKRQQLKTVEEDIVKKREWNRVYPLLIEKQKILQQLDELGDVRFPIDGVVKLEQLEHQQKLIQNRLAALREKQKQIEDELEKVNVQEEVLKNKDAIELIVEDLPTYRNDIQKMKQLQMQMQQVEEEIYRLKGKIGYQGPIESINDFNLSFARKNEVQQLTEKRKLLTERKKDLEQREAECRDKLVEVESYIEQLKFKRLNEEQRVEYEQQIERYHEQSDLSKELDMINNQIQTFAKSQNQKSDKTVNHLFLLSFFACFIVAAITFFIRYEKFSVGLLIIAISSLALYFYRLKQSKANFFVESLQKQKEQIEQQLNLRQFDVEKVESAKQKIANDDKLRHQIEIEEIQQKALSDQFDQIVQSFEEWEMEWVENERKMIEIGREYHLSQQMATEFLNESFERLEQLREKLFEQKQIEKQLTVLEKVVNEKEQILGKLTKSISVKGTDYQEKVFQLKRLLTQQSEYVAKRNHFLEKIHELEEQIQSYQIELKTINDSIADLYKLADVDSKEFFLLKGEKADRVELLHNRLEPIEKQLLYSEIKLPSSLEDIPPKVTSQAFERMDVQKKELQREIERLEKEMAQLKVEIDTLEKGGTYTDLLHQYHQEKFQLREGMKKWSVYQTAKYVLEKSMDNYKIEKLPKVIQLATDYFSILTDQNYDRIQMDQKKDTLYVKRRDGMIFNPKELSQATGEQLYVSIRFALAKTISEQLNFPFLIDDGFVHFDGSRQVQMMNLLEKLSHRGQIIFFTCHEHYLQYFPEDQITILE